MRHSALGTRCVSVPFVLLALAACMRSRDTWVELRTEPRNAPTMQITGTVQHLALEGGLFVIRDAQGTQYNAINLPEAFRVAGVLVEAEARRRDDIATIAMVGPVVELLRIRRRPGASVGSPSLPGTSWRLEDLAGAGVIDRVEATLTFWQDGQVTGSSSCNQFRGSATIAGGTIKFGPLATTRRACPEAMMNQETQYLSALQSAERFEIQEPFLYVYAAGRSQPLKFIRTKA